MLSFVKFSINLKFSMSVSATRFGIALPKWIVERENSMLVCCLTSILANHVNMLEMSLMLSCL